MKRVALAAGVLLLAACAREPSLADLERNGQTALRTGDLDAAERHIDTGTRLADARHDAPWQKRFRVLRAEVLVEEGRLPDALTLVGAEVVPAGPADPLNARLLIARGRARCLSGADTIDLGERDLDAAAALVAALPPDDLSAAVALNRGNCTWSRRDIAGAEREFRQAYAIARQQQSPIEARAAGSIGRAATQQFRFDEAVTWYERALEKLTNDLVRVKTLNNLGWCHYLLGDFERALSFLSKADALAQARGYRSEQRHALELTGNAFSRLRDLTRAADAFRRSLAIARELREEENMAELLSNLAGVALAEKQFETANTLIAEALQIQTARGDTAAVQLSRLIQGQIKAALGDTTAAERDCRDLIASPVDDRDVQWELRATLAQLLAKTGRAAEADAEFRRAFEIIEQSAAEVQQTEHRLSFYSHIDQFEDDYVDFLVARDDIRGALEVADRSRAHLLREKLQDGLPAQVLTAAQFQQAAAARNAVILFYWLAPARSFVWTVSRDGVALKTLSGENDITARVNAYRRLILRSGDPIAEESADARWLYDTLVRLTRSPKSQPTRGGCTTRSSGPCTRRSRAGRE